MEWVVKVIYEHGDDSTINEKHFTSLEEATAYCKEQNNPSYNGVALLYELHTNGEKVLIETGEE